MPYRVRTRNNRFCVIKLREGNSPQRTMGCHDTRREAEAQMTALRIAESEQSEGNG